MRGLLWILAIILNAVNLGAIVSRYEPETPFTMRLACSIGDDTACATLGYRYLNGFGVPQDLEKAQALFRDACDAEAAKGCRLYAELHAGWENPIISEEARRLQELRDRLFDKAEAAEWLQRGCDLGDWESCDHLGRMYESGDGVPVDPERAEAARRQGKDPLPLAMLLWIGSFLGSVLLAILALIWRPAGVVPVSRPKLWFGVAFTLAIIFAGLTAYQLFWAEADMATLIAIVLLVPTSLLGTAALLIRKQRYPLARRLLILCGFLSLPPGLFAVLTAREMNKAI